MSETERILIENVRELQKDIKAIKQALCLESELINLTKACELTGLSAHKIKKYPWLRDHKAKGHYVYFRNKCIDFKFQNL